MSALDRWSERKRRVAESEAEAARAAGATERGVPDPGVPDPEREAVLAANREAAEAVDLDALKPGADLAAFFRDGVPEALRRQALKAMWRSDPVFANVDRLCDYDDDFRAASKVPAAIQSAWQAGRGYLFPEDEAKPDSTAAERESSAAERESSAAEPEAPLETAHPDTQTHGPAADDGRTTDPHGTPTVEPLPLEPASDANVEARERLAPAASLRARLGL